MRVPISDYTNVKAHKSQNNPEINNTNILPRVMNIMKKIWTPLPLSTASNMPFLGGLNTSPWTSFQPNSSWASSYNTQWFM